MENAPETTGARAVVPAAGRIIATGFYTPPGGGAPQPFQFSMTPEEFLAAGGSLDQVQGEPPKCP